MASNRFVLIIATAVPFVVVAILFGSLLKHLNFSKVAKVLKSLGGVVPVERIEQELKRKSFHMQALLIPGYEFTVLKFKLVSRRELLIALGSIVTVVLCLELLRMFNTKFNDLVVKFFGPLLRPTEKRAFTGATPLIIACFITFLVFPPIVSILGMVYLSVGDASAAVVGVSYGRHKLVGKKSLEGFLGCACACAITGFILLELLTSTPLSSKFWIAVGSGLMAALAELFSNSRIDDNLAIPVVSSIAIYIVGILQGVSFVRSDIL